MPSPLRRRLMSTCWSGLSGGFDYFINSVSGSDANSGQSAALAFETLGAVTIADDLKIGLARGSEWFEEIEGVSEDGLLVQSYGSGELPIIDATDAAPTWTQPDAGGNPNVWAASINHEIALEDASRLIVLEDGIPMPRQNSIANVNANETSRYSPSDGSLTSNDPATVNIHATGSGNPNSNGRTYRITVRETAIQANDNAVVKDVECRGGAHNNGSLVLQANALIERVVVRDAGKHLTFIGGGGVMRDAVLVNPDTPFSGDGGQAIHVTYDDAANGKTGTIQRVFAIKGAAISQPDNPIGRNALYAHSQGGQLFDEILYEQCASIDLLATDDFAAGDTTQLRAHGCFARGTDRAFGVGQSAYSRNAEFLYNQCYNAQTGIFSLAPNGACSVTARHNVMSPWNWGLTRKMIDCNSNVTGTFEYNTLVGPAKYIFAEFDGIVTHRYNLYITNDSGLAFNVLTLPNGSTSDYNIFINQGSAQLKYTYNGVEYADLAAYQAGTGQEANSLEFLSVSLSDVFSGTVTDGDFRINSGGTVGAQVASLGAGAQFHWDWNERAVASGPSQAWPDVPETLAEARTYAKDPRGWSF